MAFEKLFEPIKIGAVKIKNRYALAPMNWLYMDWTGLVNEEEIAYTVARARGVGLFNYGAVLSTKFGVPFQPHPWVHCFDMSHVPGLYMIAEAIRLCGASPFIQLLPVPGNHGHAWTGIQPVAASSVELPTLPPNQRGGFPGASKIFNDRLRGTWITSTVGTATPPFPVPREVTQDEIETIIKENAMACKLAVLAGFEGIELHQCHHYFVSQFRNPMFNKRTDKYGGSADRRDKIVVTLVEGRSRGKEYKADTIEELAKEAGVDPQGLKETVDKYNSDLDSEGYDTVFGRKTLVSFRGTPIPIDKAPYYAVKCRATITSFIGGLKINTRAQVVNPYDEVIPGLYAAGEVTGGFFGKGMYLGGTMWPMSMTFGRIAGRNAVLESPWD